MKSSHLVLLLPLVLATSHAVFGLSTTPLVIATWNFVNGTDAAWREVGLNAGTALDGILVGCGVCEEEQCDGSVGYGGSPDENGESTLDAMIMDGVTLSVGSVANLRSVKNAIGVAHAVMKFTKHTLLVGSLATDFAVSMGFEKTNLSTAHSVEIYEDWKKVECQPNFRQNVSPDPQTSCGPYAPVSSKTVPKKMKMSTAAKQTSSRNQRLRRTADTEEAIYHHDTIGMIAIDQAGNIAGGTSTNGANHKIPGRVGDSPIIGSGAYVDNEAGGAAATGDGDIMMRFVPSFHAVELMRNGNSPSEATAVVISRMARFYPAFSGAVIAVNMTGHYGAACHGLSKFPFTVMSNDFNKTQIVYVDCI